MKSPQGQPAEYSINCGELPLSGMQLTDLVHQVLARELPFRFRAGGSSMNPFIRDGDVVSIAPLSGKPRLGDVVAFEWPDKTKLIVHRIIGKTSTGYIIQGDNASPGCVEAPVFQASVLGVVTCIERKGRQTHFGLGPERGMVALLSRWGWLQPLIRIAAGVYHWLMKR